MNKDILHQLYRLGDQIEGISSVHGRLSNMHSESKAKWCNTISDINIRNVAIQNLLPCHATLIFKYFGAPKKYILTALQTVEGLNLNQC